MRRLLGALAAPATTVWQGRAIVRELTLRELRAGLTDSVLGRAWLVLGPLLTLGVYAAVFGGLLGMRGGGGMRFVSSMFAGIVLFQAFSEPVSRASRLVVSRPNLVTKVVFPLELLPLPTVAQSLIRGLLSLVMLVLLHWIFVGQPAWTALLLPLALVPVLVLASGLSWLLAALGVYLRDVHELVRAALQLLFFLSPIVWTLDLLDDPLHRSMVLCNPLAVFIELARTLLSGQHAPAAGAVLGMVAAAWLLACVGLWFFRRTKEGFADVL